MARPNPPAATISGWKAKAVGLMELLCKCLLCGGGGGGAGGCWKAAKDKESTHTAPNCHRHASKVAPYVTLHVPRRWSCYRISRQDLKGGPPYSFFCLLRLCSICVRERHLFQTLSLKSEHLYYKQASRAPTCNSTG